MIKMLIHMAGAINFGYALYYDLMFVHLPAHLRGKGSFDSMQAFPGKWKYLTIWNMVLQLVYHSIALLNDFYGTNELITKRQSSLQKFRDNLFASWAFPTGIFVSIVFWSVYAMDRELMFPAVLDAIFPVWLNHSVHTAPFIFVLIEHLCVPLIYPKRFVGSAIIIGGTSLYLSWITWVNSVSGVWAYPILEVLNNCQRAIFMGGCGISILSFYFLGEMINTWRWGKPLSGSSKTIGKNAKASDKNKRKTK